MRLGESSLKVVGPGVVLLVVEYVRLYRKRMREKGVRNVGIRGDCGTGRGGFYGAHELV